MSWPGTRQLRDLVSQALYATDCDPDERKVGRRLGAGDGVGDHYGHCGRVSATLPLNRRPVLSPARLDWHLRVPRVAPVTGRSRDTFLATVIGRHYRW